MKNKISTRRVSSPPRVLPRSITAHGHAFVLVPVASSNVGAVSYEALSHLLVVAFKSGAIYCYHRVTPSVYAALLAAPSKGAYLAKHIVGNVAYPYERLPEIA